MSAVRSAVLAMVRPVVDRLLSGRGRPEVRAFVLYALGGPSLSDAECTNLAYHHMSALYRRADTGQEINAARMLCTLQHKAYELWTSLPASMQNRAGEK